MNRRSMQRDEPGLVCLKQAQHDKLSSQATAKSAMMMMAPRRARPPMAMASCSRTTLSHYQRAAYRKEHTIKDVGRYFRSSKRKICWCFGLGGEEHEVELVCSLLSGKNRIFWNKRCMTEMFRDRGKTGSPEMAWETRSGETLQIVVLAEPLAGTPHYDLMIDGTSFFKLPTWNELGSTDAAGEIESRDGSSRNSRRGFSRVASNCSVSELGSGDPLDSPRKASDPDDIEYRLSMAGLSTEFAIIEPVDELHSELFSPLLESLRHQVTQSLPQTEEMISRAIVKAFMPDTQSSNSDGLTSSSSFGSDEQGSLAEADALWEAREWVSKNMKVDPCPDANDRALAYMQKKVNATVLCVRNEEMSADDASRLLLGVAAVLGLRFAESVPVDTIILEGISMDTTLDQLNDALSLFGDVETCAISMAGRDLAFCRFMGDGSVQKLQDAAINGRIEIAGTLVRVLIVAEKVFDCNKVTSIADQNIEAHQEEVEITLPLEQQTQSLCSPPTETPHLMGALVIDGCLGPDSAFLSESSECAGSQLPKASLKKFPTDSTCTSSSSSIYYHRGAAAQGASPDSVAGGFPEFF